LSVPQREWCSDLCSSDLQTGNHRKGRHQVFSYRQGFGSSSTSSYRNVQVSAISGNPLPLKVQCPCPLPYRLRYFLAYIFSLTPILRDHNKHFSDLWDFLLHNHKKYIGHFLRQILSHL